MVSRRVDRSGPPPWCSSGHPTTIRKAHEHLLPCGCTFETATTEALDDAGIPTQERSP